MQVTGKPDATCSLVEMSELVDWCLVVLCCCLCVHHGHLVPCGHIAQKKPVRVRVQSCPAILGTSSCQPVPSQRQALRAASVLDLHFQTSLASGHAARYIAAVERGVLYGNDLISYIFL